MAMNLGKMVEKLGELPPSIHKYYKEIGQLDVKVTKLMRENKEKSRDFVRNARRMSAQQKHTTYTKLAAQFEEIVKLSEKKVEIAQLMYDLVDEHIKHVDEHIDRFKQLQLKKFSQEAKKLDALNDDTDDNDDRKNRKRGRAEQPGTEPKRRKGDESKRERLAQNAALLEAFSPEPLLPVIDMAVDPNEPTYCVCHQVSFGKMICCDNPNCTYEWFHFQCVGLDATPKGKWYCDNCRSRKK